MEKFNLDKYLANPSRKLVTRCGYSVRILCTDKKSSLPIVALITDKNGEEFVGNYNSFGKYNDSNYDCSFDLFFASKKHIGWTNVYRLSKTNPLYCCEDIYDSEEKARNISGGAIATVRIEWED